MFLKDSELFLITRTSWCELQDVESDCLREWSALTEDNMITFLQLSESWGDMNSDVLVSLLVSLVFWNEVEVVSSDDDCSLHVAWLDDSREDSTSDGNLWCEWTLVIDICAIDCLLWCCESHANLLVISLDTCEVNLSLLVSLVGMETLFLECSFCLFGHLFFFSIDVIQESRRKIE